jgi:energy-coupling factor transporter ATP-binding protein EcfA2
VRYELIEFAAVTLAARVQRLVPLHAACVGRRDRGLLLLGASGAGKSTMCLAAALAGVELLSEDSVFVAAERMLATGLPNYLHVRRDGLRFVDDRAARRSLAAAPTIRRRSGARKLEVDLRESALPVSRRALQIAGVVVLSARRAKSGALLRSLRRADVLASLRGSQGYARHQPAWDRFERKVGQLPGYVLRRGSHPREGAEALRAILDSAR